jgi:hypothetical protein
MLKNGVVLKKTHFRYEKLIFRQKEPHIQIPDDQFSNAEKNFIENGRKMTKLEAFMSGHHLLNSPIIIHITQKTLTRDMLTFQ